MRRALAEAGVPQPRFAAVRKLSERHRAADEVGFPAVLKPADSGGQRGIFLVESVDDIDAHLHEALSASPTQEAILEQYVEGTEMNGIVIARNGEAWTLTLSDRLRPPGIGFGVGWIHVYPATIYGDQLEESERIAALTAPDARPRERDRLPAADRIARRRRRGGRVRSADPGRPDGRPRAPCGRGRPDRRAAPRGARRGAAGRARVPAVPPAARDPLPHRGAGAAHRRAASFASARSRRCSPSPASSRPTRISSRAR